ncbi:MAG: pilus assembly protein PilM [Planctomycetota bacterium]|jgi:type IV pilus assembly protein PilM
MGVGVGVDPGAGSIKIVQVRTGALGVSITSAARVQRSSDGFPAAEELLRALTRAKARRRATLGLSGRDLMLRYLAVPPVPPWRLMKLVEFEIRENMAGGGEDISSDFRPLNLPTGLKQGLVVLTAVAKNAYLEDAISRARAARIKVNAASPSAVALFRGFIASREFKSGESTYLLDIGREKVEMAIQQDGNLFFARNTTGAAGERVTQSIDGAFGIGRDRAEKYKLGKARLSLGPPAGADKRQLLIHGALREAGDGIVGAIGAGLRFARMQTKVQDLDFDRLVISGGAARLAGLCEFLEKRLEKPVTFFDPSAAFDTSRLRGEARTAFQDASSEMAVATGLAVMDAESKAFSLSLLPPQEVARRAFWGRTVFGYAAGALAAVLAGVMLVRARADLARAREDRAVIEKEMKELESRAEAVGKIEEKNELARGQVGLFLRKARVNRALLEFLVLQRTACPEGLKLTRLKLVDPKDASLEFEGRSQGIGEQAFLAKMDGFEAALARSPLVKKDTLKMSQIPVEDKKAPADLRAFRCECSLNPWGARHGTGAARVIKKDGSKSGSKNGSAEPSAPPSSTGKPGAKEKDG